jgi:hypothetical protein
MGETPPDPIEKIQCENSRKCSPLADFLDAPRYREVWAAAVLFVKRQGDAMLE